MCVTDERCAQGAIVQLRVRYFAEPFAFGIMLRVHRIPSVDLLIMQKLYTGSFIQGR